MQTEQSTEPVDTGPTGAKEEGETGGKAKGRREKGSIDWGPIKRDWNNGVAVAEIREKYGIGLSSIYSQAKRHRWTRRETIIRGKTVPVNPTAVASKAVEKAIETTVSQQVPAIQQAVREKLNVWFQKVLVTTDRLHKQVDEMSEGRLEVEEIKSLSSSLETVDRIARRTFGLDSPAGSTVSVFSVSAPVVSCPVIDVEPIPEATPASVT